jgi:CSLREA domain-containing protein
MSSSTSALVKSLRRAVGIGLLAVIALRAGLAPVAQASTITVTTTADELATDGNCSLREAIQAANMDMSVDACLAGSSADTIILPAGLYVLSIGGRDEDAAASGDLDIASDLTISGALSTTTTIDGGALDRVFEILPASHVSIANLTIRNGNTGSGGEGGGIRNAGTLHLTDSTVVGNVAEDVAGGGIRNSGTLTVTGSMIADNVAASGGGVDSNGWLTLTGSTVDGNFGGGVTNAGTATVAASAISRNSSESSGGGIANLRGTLTVSSSTIVSNTAELGGGIRNSGTLTVTASTVAGNAGEIGGGVASDAGSATFAASTINNNSGIGIANLAALAVTDSTISGNTDNGIFNDTRGTLEVTSSRIGSSADSGLNNRGTLILSDSTVVGNMAVIDGGGIRNSGTLTATNSTISGNSAPGNGGGIASSGPLVALNNVTITQNTANSQADRIADGGGIYSGGGAFVLKNSLVAGNMVNSSGQATPLQPDCSGIFSSLGHNLVGDRQSPACAGLADGVNGDLVGDSLSGSAIDPKLGPLADNGGATSTHALLTGSPAIDAGSRAPPGGDGGACAPLDQRGVSRPQGSRCDIGAYELAAPPIIDDISPSSVEAGSPSFTLIVTGTNFVSGATVHWNGAERPTTFVSDSQLTAAIAATDVLTAGTAIVAVSNPGPGKGISSPRVFTIVQQGQGPGSVSLYFPIIVKLP